MRLKGREVPHESSLEERWDIDGDGDGGTQIQLVPGAA